MKRILDFILSVIGHALVIAGAVFAVALLLVSLTGCEEYLPPREPNPIIGTYENATLTVIFEDYNVGTYNGAPMIWYQTDDTHYVISDTYLVVLVRNGIFVDGDFLERQP